MVKRVSPGNSPASEHATQAQSARLDVDLVPASTSLPRSSSPTELISSEAHAARTPTPERPSDRRRLTKPQGRGNEGDRAFKRQRTGSAEPIQAECRHRSSTRRGNSPPSQLTTRERVWIRGAPAQMAIPDTPALDSLKFPASGGQLEHTSSLLSDLTHAPGLQQLAGALLSGGSGSQESLQNWMAAVNVAVQQAQQSGDPAAHALLARLTSTGSVQSSKLLNPAKQGAVEREQQQMNLPAFRSAPAFTQEPRLPPAASDPGRQFPNFAQPAVGKTQSLGDSRISSSAPRQRLQATNFRVYSNTFQNQEAAHRRAPSAAQQANSPAWKSKLEAKSREAVVDKKRNAWLTSAGSSGSKGRQELQTQQPSARLAAFPASSPAIREQASDPNPFLGTRSNPYLPPLESGTWTPEAAALHMSPPSSSLPPVAQGEEWSAWLRQRYNSLGQSLSSSEALINRLSGLSPSALPLVLARLQAAQHLQGAAAAQGVLPAAAALGPLLQLQALFQTISGDAGTPNLSQAPLTRTLPFSSLEAFRQTFGQPGGEARHSSPLLDSRPPRAQASLPLSKQQSAGPPKGADDPQADLQGWSTRNSPVEESRLASMQPAAGQDRRWEEVRQSPPKEAEAFNEDSASPRACSESSLPDPHNPFELTRHRLSHEEKPRPPQEEKLRLSREESLVFPPMWGSKLPDSTSGSRMRGSTTSGDSLRLGSVTHSAPPLIKVPVAAVRQSKPAGSSPRAATVSRTPGKECENEADEQAAETLLSLFGPSKSQSKDQKLAVQDALNPTPHRRTRTQRMLVPGAERRTATKIEPSTEFDWQQPSSGEEDTRRRGMQATARGVRHRGKLGGEIKRKAAKGDDDDAWLPRKEARKLANTRREADPTSNSDTTESN